MQTAIIMLVGLGTGLLLAKIISSWRGRKEASSCELDQEWSKGVENLKRNEVYQIVRMALLPINDEAKKLRNKIAHFEEIINDFKKMEECFHKTRIVEKDETLNEERIVSKYTIKNI